MLCVVFVLFVNFVVCSLHSEGRRVVFQENEPIGWCNAEGAMALSAVSFMSRASLAPIDSGAVNDPDSNRIPADFGWNTVFPRPREDHWQCRTQ